MSPCSLVFGHFPLLGLCTLDHTSLVLIEGEICKLRLNCSVLKFRESWILNDQSLKSHIEISYKRFWTNTSLLEILIHELNRLRFMS